jgi:predicted molibdopterin-dependent oxidoreductase YjgC
VSGAFRSDPGAAGHGGPPGGPLEAPVVGPRTIEATVDGRPVRVPERTTVLEACRREGVEVPTLCFLETLSPANACRLCVVEVDGSRALVPSCSRVLEPGMVVRTDSERVRRSRRMVLELLASCVDLSVAGPGLASLLDRYGVRPDRYGPPAPPAPAGELGRRRAGRHIPPDGTTRATAAQPAKQDNELYVRDLGRCVLCYRCVQACGADAQHTFAIAIAGRGFDARVSTEFDVPLPESACVYCGNCVAVCPTGALMARTEYELRRTGAFDERRQRTTRTVCPYCGVGCNLELTVQDGRIVKVTSPVDHDVTRGSLCVKGRFGVAFVEA